MHEDFQAIIRKITCSVPSRWNEFASLVPKECSSIVERCFEKNSSNRYTGFRELLLEWDTLVATEDSPKWTGWFRKDPRVPISDKTGGFYISELFPERLAKTGRDVLSRTKFTEYKAFKDACEYRRLGSYERALEECIKVLGDISNPQSNLSKLLSGKVESAAGLEHSWSADGKLCQAKITPNKQLLNGALGQIMCVYVDLIESRGELGKQYIVPFNQLADQVARSNYSDFHVLTFCAQAFLKAGDYGRAASLLLQLIKRDPKNPRPWATLVSTFVCAGRQERLAKVVVEDLYDALGNQVDDYLSQFVCGKASIACGDWRMGAQFMARAFELDPNSLEVLHDRCGCLINAGLTSQALNCFESLRSIAPSSPYTAKLGRFFVNN